MAHTREGVEAAKTKGRLRGKHPSSPRHREPSRLLCKDPQHATAEIASLYKTPGVRLSRIEKDVVLRSQHIYNANV